MSRQAARCSFGANGTNGRATCRVTRFARNWQKLIVVIGCRQRLSSHNELDGLTRYALVVSGKLGHFVVRIPATAFVARSTLFAPGMATCSVVGRSLSSGIGLGLTRVESANARRVTLAMSNSGPALPNDMLTL